MKQWPNESRVIKIKKVTNGYIVRLDCQQFVSTLINVNPARLLDGRAKIRGEDEQKRNSKRSSKCYCYFNRLG